jgi:hypothetical protein
MQAVGYLQAGSDARQLIVGSSHGLVVAFARKVRENQCTHGPVIAKPLGEIQRIPSVEPCTNVIHGRAFEKAAHPIDSSHAELMHGDVFLVTSAAESARCIAEFLD